MVVVVVVVELTAPWRGNEDGVVVATGENADDAAARRATLASELTTFIVYAFATAEPFLLYKEYKVVAARRLWLWWSTLVGAWVGVATELTTSYGGLRQGTRRIGDCCMNLSLKKGKFRFQ